MTDHLTMTMDPAPTTMTGIPINYVIRSTRPPAQRKAPDLPPRLVADLRQTIGGEGAITFVVEGMSAPQIRKLASRLNAVGRRGDFTVRTRKTEGLLYAWAVARQPKRAPRTKKADIP